MPNPYLLEAALLGTPLSQFLKAGFVPAGGGGGDPAAAGGDPSAAAAGAAPMPPAPAPGAPPGGVPMPPAPPPAGAPGTSQAVAPPPVPGIDPGLQAAIQQVMAASGGGAAGGAGGKGNQKDLIPQQIGELARQVYVQNTLLMNFFRQQGMEIPDAALLGPPPGPPGAPAPGGAPGAAPAGGGAAGAPPAGAPPGGGDPAAAGAGAGAAMPIAPELAPKTAAEQATAFTSLGVPVPVVEQPPVNVTVPQVPTPLDKEAGAGFRKLSERSEAILAILNRANPNAGR